MRYTVKHLMDYSSYGNLESIQEMVDEGFDVTQKDENGATALHCLARGWATPAIRNSIGSESVDVVKLLISKGVDVNAVDNTGMTALHYAAGRYGIDAIVNELLNVQGININAVDNEGRTPLQIAVFKCARETVKILITKGVNLTPPDNGTNLHFFASLAYVAANEFNEELNKDGVEVDAKDEKGRTALHYAVMYDQFAAVEALIAKGANVNAVDSRGYSALHHARSADERTINALLEAGADVKAVDNEDKDTPLHTALRTIPVNEAVVKALVAAGADVNATSKDGYTPAFWAAFTSSVSLDTLKLLITAENVNAPLVYPRDSKENSTYFHSAAHRSIEIVRYFLSIGAHVNAKNGRGAVPLQFAVNNQDPAVLDLLLKQEGIDTAAKNGALRWAARLNNDKQTKNDPNIAQKVKALLEAGADVRAVDSEGKTPLHIAAQCGTGLTITQLLEAAADVKAVDNKGKTPLHYLLERHVTKGLVEEFLAKGVDLYAVDNKGKTPFDYYKDLDAEVSKFLKSKRTWSADIKHLLSHPMSNNWFVPAMIGTACVALVVGYCALAYHFVKSHKLPAQVSYSPSVVNDMLSSISNGTGMSK